MPKTAKAARLCSIQLFTKRRRWRSCWSSTPRVEITKPTGLRHREEGKFGYRWKFGRRRNRLRNRQAAVSHVHGTGSRAVVCFIAHSARAGGGGNLRRIDVPLVHPQL